MRKILSFTLFLLILSSCDPAEWMNGYEARWYIKNNTDITFKASFPDVRWSRDSICNPGDSICIYLSGRYLGQNEFPPFEDILEMNYLYIYDMDGNLLREWIQATTPPSLNTIYYKEYWRHYYTHNIYFTWVYDITKDTLGIE